MDLSWAYGIVLLLLLLQECCSVLAIVSSKVHIVYMGNRHHGEPQLVEDSHHQILSEIFGSKEAAMESILYSYKHGFSGFAALLTPSQAKLIADFPGVVRVVPHRILNLHTTRSWDFLQMYPNADNGILSKGQSGAGCIIGVMDTGIWPESESFNEVNMRPKPPRRWKGICQEGEQFNSSSCNKKIIGARWYAKGYEAEFGKIDTSDGFEFLSPRDASGHGTHTSSTAAGALINNANFMGLARGLARGGAPSAWLSVYKVCWATGGCSSADLLAAFDHAILDRVDVLSLSLGSTPPLSTYVDDVLSIGSFHAVASGIVVVCSAGNSGPYPATVFNTAPWVITVAASTIDRAFPTKITLGNNQTVVGQAFYKGKNVNTFYPIVYGEDIALSGAEEDSASCDTGSLNATLAQGKVVLCFQSVTQRSAATAADTVVDVQGVGVIFAQIPTKDVELILDVPCVQVDFTIGTYLLTYLATSSNPVVKFSYTKTTLGHQTSPEVALFSSRGPSSLSPAVLKPDVAAPGVNILSSWSPASSSQDPNTPQNQHLLRNFKIVSGTSMACPHISGIVALLKVIHPAWSPAAIKSALITTASVKDDYGQNAVAEGAPHKQADPFDYGGGHVDPNKAMDPGLIFDMKPADYVQFLCSMGYNDTSITNTTQVQSPCQKKANFLLNLNLPSISIPELKNRMTVSRTVTNVGPTETVYYARVEAPPGINVVVKPSILFFNFTRKKLKFKVTFCTQQRVQGRYAFGNLFWGDGFHVVRMPLIVRAVIQDFYADT
ncbi:subtilisin-like protease SBT3.9 [Cornus florida]|uniref:subtilisin-like protease SBT3.9 n=1 Tax=Cornus florida TaxID=4283 RepID=UPI0028A1C61B|nr:subtilisin-like protease SBT3.9 [Cornus florida]